MKMRVYTWGYEIHKKESEGVAERERRGKE